MHACMRVYMYSLTTTSHYLMCQHMVTQKELLCITLCGCVSHVHIQHGHVCPRLAINSTYKAKIVTVTQVA